MESYLLTVEWFTDLTNTGSREPAAAASRLLCDILADRAFPNCADVIQ